MDEFAAQVNGVGALAEPTRRALYRYVVSQPGPVSRDEAAAGAGLPRHAAKFHLDKLVEEGLLDTEFRRLTGRRGPGAGRPTKLYRRSERQLSITLPPRHYDLAGQILAGAVEDAERSGAPVREAVERAAATAGRRLAATESPSGSGRPDDPVQAVDAALAARGYEPRIQGDSIVLSNCPFHALARDHTELVCDMNLHLITALLDELGHAEMRAGLEPAPGRCCVTVRNERPNRSRR